MHEQDKCFTVECSQSKKKTVQGVNTRMLKVVYSNNMGQLAGHLAEQLRTSPLEPFQAETILVQNNELSRWLSLFLAERQHVAANLKFPFPSAYIWDLFRQLWPDIP